ncbi:MAG: hypothetical protein RXP86_07805 [Acidilobus sp.]|jgi:hypothetical protein
MNEVSWADVSSPEGLKNTILEIVVGVAFMVGGVGAGILAGVGDYILSVFNRTGFTIPSSANYVAPIASLPSFLPLILMIAFMVVGIVIIIEALLKYYGNLGA